MDQVAKFKNKLIKDNIQGLALDIDDTLVHTYSFWAKELSKKFGNPENLSDKELYKKYRRIQDYPVWNKKEALDWINWAIHQNELQPRLPLIENSNHIVNKIHKIVPVVAYITARPQNVIKGTIKWLEKHSFPKAEIIAAPKRLGLVSSSILKANILEDLYPYILGIVDDNPNLIDNLTPNYKGKIFIYNHPTYIPSRKNVVSCLTWEDVLKEVKKLAIGL
jgi:hypothetical protein